MDCVRRIGKEVFIMALNNTKALIDERRQLMEGDTEISERSYNLIIGGMLLWGFLLNYVMVAVFGDQIVRAVADTNPLIFLVLYFGLVIVGNVLISRKGAALSFLGYNMIAAPIGIVICMCVEGIAPSVVREAVLLTAIITLTFMIAATVYPEFFLKMGRVLVFSLMILIVGELICLLFFRSSPIVFEWLGAGIFSLFIGFDWARANQCAHTVDNAIDMSASLYLDIVNLFLRLLSILGRRKD